MKKQFLTGVAATLGLASSFSGAIYATGTYEQSVIDCLVNSQEPVCSLDYDIALTDPIIIPADRTVTFDLGDHKVTAKDNFSAKNTGLIAVSNGADLTLKGAKGKITTEGTEVYAAVAMTHKSTYNSEKTAKLTVDGPTLEGFYYGVVGNGGRHNTSIVLNSGYIKGLNTDAVDGSFGIYQPQTGSITINGGAVSGFDGIGIKSGNLTINGGVVAASGEVASLNKKGHGSGINPNGAAIQVESNTGYAGNVNIRINDGTITSEHGYGIFEFLATSAQPATSSLKSLSISQGMIVSDKGATNLSSTAAKLVVENGSIAETTTERIAVTKVADVEGLTAEQEVEMAKQENTIFDEQEKIDQYNAVAELKDYTIDSIFDIKICRASASNCLDSNRIGHTTPLANPLTFSLAVSDIVVAPLAEGYTREYAVVHVTRDKAEILPSTLSKDGKTLTFSATEFSDFALVYKDVKNPEIPDAPKTGVETKVAHKMFNWAGLTACSATGAMIAGVVAIVRAKRRH